MGYYTRFELEAKYADCASPAEAIATLCRDNEEAAYCLNRDGSSGENGKWYDHEKALLTLSRQFPHLLFTLSGEGETSGDLWKKYFLNGRMQAEKAAVAIAPFDPQKLKEGA